MLKRYKKIDFDELSSLDTLQVWTEAGLRKLAERRVKSKYNNKK